ncbi:MAG: HAMP domain-containing protein [Phycisphaerae bacterium]|nr:HAMP domain-containing protein [Phycisphaerae bacterium]
MSATGLNRFVSSRLFGQGTLFWRLFVGTVLLIVLVLSTCTWLVAIEVERFHRQSLTASLQAQAACIRQATRDWFTPEHGAELQAFIRELAAAGLMGTRITAVRADGAVLADSEADPHFMGSHADRAEVQQALASGWGEDIRFSQTVGREMKYVAIRVGSAESPAGVVRLAVAMRTVGERTAAIRRLIRTIAFVGVLAAAVFAMGLAVVWSRPIHRITRIAHILSHGDLSARAPVRGHDEIAMLARSLNEMRDRTAAQLEIIDRQRRTLERLLAQLREGVIVSDAENRILLINPAAVHLLALSSRGDDAVRPWIGLAIEQCVSHPRLQEMLRGIGATDACNLRVQTADGSEAAVLARVSDITLPVAADRRDAGPPEAVGRMLVLSDISDLTHAVQVKTDFAANASHELRTPLSAIRAAAETLMHIEPADEPASVKRFVDVIGRQARRMEAMVADLLDLSRIESAPSQFKPEPIDLTKLADELHARYADRLEARRLQWSVNVPPGLGPLRVSPYLLQVVLDNLIDNAIKFTEPGGRIAVTCCPKPATAEAEARIAIEVVDTGCGIPEAEQARVFERFYQVAKARSGADRGTGLGLSIVRHAVAAMNGTLTLRSRPGDGTRVSVIVPQPDLNAGPQKNQRP